LALLKSSKPAEKRSTTTIIDPIRGRPLDFIERNLLLAQFVQLRRPRRGVVVAEGIDFADPGPTPSHIYPVTADGANRRVSTREKNTPPRPQAGCTVMSGMSPGSPINTGVPAHTGHSTNARLRCTQFLTSLVRRVILSSARNVARPWRPSKTLKCV